MSWQPNETIRFDLDASEASMNPVLSPRGLRMGTELGRGGMGVVHQATQLSLQREVAVKTLRPDAPASAKLTLLREAWVTGLLEHPNIVPVHELVVDDDGFPRLVLKRIEGRGWEELLSNPEQLPEIGQSDPFAFHVGVLIQVCNALRFAHAKGIVHRDLKPDNIMVGAFGEVYLLDWGIAIGLQPDPTGRIPDRNTHPAIVGTPLYMAPEMFVRGGEFLSTTTDVHLLAGLLYRLVVGHPAREAGTLEEMMAASAVLPFFPESCPKDLQELMVRCFQVRPSDRPSVEEVEGALQSHLLQRDADQLLHSALEGLRRLRLLVEEVDEGGSRVSSLYNLYGACRFGLEEALARFPNHARARAAQEELTTLMVRFELGKGNPATANTLLGQMRDPPTDLRGAVLKAQQDHKKEQERLHAIELQASGSAGLLGRVVFAILYMLATLSFPFLLSLLGLERSYGFEVIRNIVVAMVVLLGIGLTFSALRRSQMNRGFVVMALCSPVFRMFVAMAMWRIEAPIAGLIVLTALVDALILVLGTALMDVRVLPAALVYVVAAFLAGAFPVYASPILVAGTLLVIFSLGLSWSYLYVKR